MSYKAYASTFLSDPPTEYIQNLILSHKLDIFHYYNLIDDDDIKRALGKDKINKLNDFINKNFNNIYKMPKKISHQIEAPTPSPMNPEDEGIKLNTAGTGTNEPQPYNSNAGPSPIPNNSAQSEILSPLNVKFNPLKEGAKVETATDKPAETEKSTEGKTSKIDINRDTYILLGISVVAVAVFFIFKK